MRGPGRPSQLYRLAPGPPAPARPPREGPPAPGPGPGRTALTGVLLGAALAIGAALLTGAGARLVVGELPEPPSPPPPLAAPAVDDEAVDVFSVLRAQLEAIDRLDNPALRGSDPTHRPHAGSRAVTNALRMARAAVTDPRGRAYVDHRAHDALVSTLTRREREAVDTLLLELAFAAREAGAPGKARHVAVSVRARGGPTPYPNHLLRRWGSLLETDAPLADVRAARAAAWGSLERRVEALQPAATEVLDAYIAQLPPGDRVLLRQDPRVSGAYGWGRACDPALTCRPGVRPPASAR